jgi:hypothetical protein
MAAPAAPVISVMQNGYGMVYINWAAVAGATSYKVYEGHSTAPTTLKATVTTPLSDGTFGYIFMGTGTEFVRLKANNLSGDSAYGNEVRVAISIGRLPTKGSSQALQHIKGT